MTREEYEKIEAYLGVLEELELQLLELTVARDAAGRARTRLEAQLHGTTRPRRRATLRQHLDPLIEGIAGLERGIHALSGNIEHYRSRFTETLKEVRS